MPQEVFITLMMRTFLYLPLYVADELKLFKKHVPHGYEVSLERRSGEQLDREVYERVVEDKAGDENIWFGVGDPMPVYQSKNSRSAEERKGRVIAALINKATFWAVDRNTSVSHYYELPIKFEKIITFKEGTTCNVLAKDVAVKRSTGVTIESIIVEGVEPGYELRTLAALKSEPKVVAITPNLLETINYTNAGKLKICYSFATSGMFSNLLVTAIITREDVIANHAPLVRGILLALEEAYALIHLRDDRVIEIGSKIFNSEKNIITQTLNRALDEDLFPTDIRVERDSWYNAVRIHHRAKGLKEPEPKDLDESFAFFVNRKLVQDVKEKYILPLIAGRNKPTFIEKVKFFIPLLAGFSSMIAAGFTSDGIMSPLFRYFGLLLVLIFFGRQLSNTWRLFVLPKGWQAIYIAAWGVVFLLATLGYDIAAGNQIAAKFLGIQGLHEWMKGNFATILVGAIGAIFVALQQATLTFPHDKL
jgi:hypothetical protein